MFLSCFLSAERVIFISFCLKRPLPRLPKGLHNSKEELAQLYLDKVCFCLDRFKDCQLKCSYGNVVAERQGEENIRFAMMKVKPTTSKMHVVFFFNNLSRTGKDKQLELFSVPVSHFLLLRAHTSATVKGFRWDPPKCHGPQRIILQWKHTGAWETLNCYLLA